MTSIIDPTAQAEPAADQVPSRGPVSPDPVQLTLEVGPMAHGGHCIARHEGRPVFVRHAIPGEVVVAELTAAGPSDRFWRADTVEVLRASEFRRSHQWKLADSLRAYPAGRQPIGGAEYGHIVLEHQRRLKAHVFRDTMARIGRQSIEDVEVHVEGMDGDEPAGLHWRTRNAFAVSPSGRLSMPVHRSRDTVAVRNIPLAVPELDELELWGADFSGALRVEVTTPGHGREALIMVVPGPQAAGSPEALTTHADAWRRQLSGQPDHVSAMVAVPPGKRGRPGKAVRLRGRPWVQEDVASERFGAQSFRVSGGGFWQVHRDAPVTLVEAVMQAADAQPGHVVADLYAGAGLFSRFLAEAVGPDGAVLSVEAAPGASRDARRNLHGVPQAIVLNGKTDRVVGRWLHAPDAGFSRGGLDGRRVDTVVLDPPRAGAGRVAVHRIHQLDPDKIVYVSGDPASFARDTRRLNDHGWALDSVKVYDLSPDTHRMTSVSVFTRH